MNKKAHMKCITDQSHLLALFLLLSQAAKAGNKNCCFESEKKKTLNLSF